MEQNKTGKYLKYAIGEILLVIVGILIALQINNWNENRVSQARIDSRLINLINDIETEIKEMDDINEASKGRIIVIHEILKRRNKLGNLDLPDKLPSEWRLENIQNPNRSLSVTKTFDGNRPTYNELINSGEFYIIKDQSLAKKIQKYYGKIDELKDTERWNNMENFLMIIKSKHRLGLGTYSNDGTLDKLTDLAESDKQFGAELEHEILLDYHQLKLITELKLQAEELIEIIESVRK